LSNTGFADVLGDAQFAHPPQQVYCELLGRRPSKPRRMSVRPVASQTRTPTGNPIIAAAGERGDRRGQCFA
jgi:hypothetical protein